LTMDLKNSINAIAMGQMLERGWSAKKLEEWLRLQRLPEHEEEWKKQEQFKETQSKMPTH
jgi:hypothetical protein